MQTNISAGMKPSGSLQSKPCTSRLTALITGLTLLCILGSTLITSNHISAAETRRETATFAGGCFWCMEQPFDELDGVIATTAGYTGGRTKNPTYEQVSAGGTGHTEAIQVLYDPGQISYATLLAIFWKNIDPLAQDRQFCDVGNQYRSAIFYQDAAQKKLAEASRQSLEKARSWKIVTEIVPAGLFYQAEAYHQDYYKKNPLRYKFYRNGCGRDKRLKELWGESKK